MNNCKNQDDTDDGTEFEEHPDIVTIQISTDINNDFLLTDDIGADMFTIQRILQQTTPSVNWNS